MPVADSLGKAELVEDFDLVQIIVHEKASGEWSSNNAPAFRLTMRFVTTERSPNHAQGQMSVKLDLPPASKCANGPFAEVQTQLRGIDDKGEMNAVPYSVLQGQLFLHVERKTTYVFRRRS